MQTLEERTIQRIARKVLRRNILGALDLELATPAQQAKFMDFVTGQVPSMDDASIAYAAYASEAIQDPAVAGLTKALWAQYRIRLLKWFGYAIKQRASMGGGGVGLKHLKDGIAAFIEDLPVLLVKGYKPMNHYIKGGISDVIEADKLDAVSAKVYKVISEAYRASLTVARTARAQLSVAWDAKMRVWYIPPSLATFPVKDQLSRAGFRWDPQLRRWETPKLTPAMGNLVEVPTVKPAMPQGSVEAVGDWFFGTWLPANIKRFDTVFNTYLKSKETSYSFTFKLSGRNVEVDIDRVISGPKDAVEELRHRYIGRQGRKPWLEVLDRYIDLHRTTGLKDVMLLIDRMNNLQHSNGLFMEQFPRSVHAWYLKFLDRKYSARDAWILASFVPDADLREVLQFYARAYGMRGRQQGDPDIPIQQKEVPSQGVNWREKGYPYERGKKQPSRFDPKVQEGLSGVPKSWD